MVKKKFDPTIPAVIGVLILVVVLANVMPSCSSDEPAEVVVPGTPGAAGTTSAAGQTASKSPPIWLSADGDPYAGYPHRTVDAPVINRHAMGGTEVAMGTDGKSVILNVAMFDDRMDYVRDASSTEPWLNESLDVWIAAAAADATLYRFSVDVTGRTAMQSYDDMTGKRATPGTAATSSATAEVTTAFYGWEAQVRIPLAEVGIEALAADSSVRLQIHRNQGGVAGTVTALVRAGKVSATPPDLTLANLVPVWARPATPVVPSPATGMPKTDPAFIAFVDDIQQDGPLAMPALRQANGQPFTTTTTDLRVSTDGTTLRVDARCFDPKPEEMVTSHSDPGDFTPFRDDSLELFFLSADPAATWYYQFCISNTGEYQIYRCKNVAENMILRPYEPSEAFSVVVRKHAKGFDVQMWVPLAELGLADGLKPGDELRLQLVRNWRGQHVPGSSLLQLFPAAIYAHATDLSNHHRATMVPCRVIVPDAVEN